MNLMDLMTRMNLKQMQEWDSRNWRATLRVGDTVPAGQSLPTVLSVSNRGVFLLTHITGRFTTIDGAETAEDTGVCKLSVTMQNGSGRMYIQDPLYLDTFLTPGRVKSDADLDGEPGNALQFGGMEFITLFQPKDDITFAVKNEAARDNSWQMSLHGFWLT